MSTHLFTKNDIDIVDVSPLQAKAWLEDCNVKNRRINHAHVLRIVSQMEKGQWLFNGDTICFDWNGDLVDGQHRLSAIAESGMTVKLIVVRNLDPQCIMTKDIEMKPRSLGDLLSMDKVKNCIDIAATVIRACALNRGRVILKSGNTNSPLGTTSNRSDASVWDKYDYYYEHKTFFDNVALIALKLYAKRRAFLTKSEIGAIFAHLILEKGHSEEKVNDFFTQLYYGNETCPAITALRDKLNKDIDRGNSMLSSYKQNLFIKTWNYYIKGKKAKNITYDSEKDGYITFI